jgi:hypothetical protein
MEIPAKFPMGVLGALEASALPAQRGGRVPNKRQIVGPSVAATERILRLLWPSVSETV